MLQNLSVRGSAIKRSNAIFSFTLLLIASSAEAAPKNIAKPTPVPEPNKSLERPATLVGDVNRFGWYIAPSASYSSIRMNRGMLVGGKAGIILDHTLVLGAAGYGFLSDVFGTNGARTSLTYGGVFGEYIFNPEELFHFSAGLLIGFGSANDISISVLNPQLSAIMNVSQDVHLGFELSYRYTHTLETNRPNADWFSGISAGVFIQFGSF